MFSHEPSTGIYAYMHHKPTTYRSMISEWSRHSKSAVCDSIRPSGMDLYYTGLPDAHSALETLCSFFVFPRTPVFLTGPHAEMTESTASVHYLHRVLLQKKCKTIIGSLCCIDSSASWLTRSRSLRADGRIQNQEQRSQLLCSITRIGLWIAVDNLLQVSHLKIASNILIVWSIYGFE